MILCQICQRECASFLALATHIKKHNINKKDYYDKYIKKDDEGICPECKKETKFLKLSKGYSKYCSSKCNLNSKQFKEKYKHQFIKKYGVEHISQTQEYKDKYRQTCLKKYGVENPFQANEIINKKKQKYFKKYGVENPFQANEIIKKIKQTNFYNIYNNKILKLKEVKPLFLVDEYKGMIINNNRNYTYIKYKWQCNICGNIFEDHMHSPHIPRCLNCYPLKPGYSKQEKEVVSYIKSIYAGYIEENTKQIIAPYELDIYLPELKLAIEYNGKYWHKDKENYHEMKTNLCQSKGIKLLHIAEKDWLNKQKLIKDDINNNIIRNNQ